MVKVTSLCVDCVQVITNPLCPNCFSKHVIAWLRDKKISSYRMNKIKNKFDCLIIEANEIPSDIKCILCGVKKVNFCVYCFTNRAYKIVENGTGDEIANKFHEDFNTKIWRIRS